MIFHAIMSHGNCSNIILDSDGILVSLAPLHTLLNVPVASGSGQKVMVNNNKKGTM